MKPARRTSVAAMLLAGICAVAFSVSASAEEPAFDVIANHLKSHYHATEKHIPFMGLAYFAVKVVRPAGVKNLRVKIFEHLNYSHDGLDQELNSALADSLGPSWSSIIRVFSRNDHSQTLVYAKEEGKHMRLMIVNLSQEDATIVRVKVDMNSLQKFIDNPKILGISLQDS